MFSIHEMQRRLLHKSVLLYSWFAMNTCKNDHWILNFIKCFHVYVITWFLQSVNIVNNMEVIFNVKSSCMIGHTYLIESQILLIFSRGLEKVYKIAIIHSLSLFQFACQFFWKFYHFWRILKLIFNVKILFIFREGKGRRKRRKETSMCGCLLSALYWGPGCQPRHVPWLQIEPETLWFTGSVLNPLSHTSQGLTFN